MRVSGRGHAGGTGGPAGRPVRARERRAGPALRAARRGSRHAPRRAVHGRGARAARCPCRRSTARRSWSSSPALSRRRCCACADAACRRCAAGAHAATCTCVMNVLIPSQLTDEQRELLRKLRGLRERRHLLMRDSTKACSTASGRPSVLDPARRPLPRASEAEAVLAELLEMAPSGVEQVTSPTGWTESWSTRSTGRAGELPDARRVRGGGGRCARRGASPRRSPTTGPSAGSGSTSRCWSAGRLYVRPPWEEPAHRGGVEEVVIDPGGAFGTGTHPDHADVPGAAARGDSRAAGG